MLTKFKRSVNAVFLDPLRSETIVCEKGKKLDIILSPRIYWVKKMTLPVSTVREVTKLLPSIFEDSLPLGHYSYYAYKHENEFILFAYEDKKILDLIASKGISSADIGSIHFAQTEFEDLEGGVRVTDKESMYSKDRLLVLAPTSWIKESKELDLENIRLSKHSIKLQQFGHIVDNKSLYKIGGILLAFALILIIEIFVTNSKTDTIEQKKEALFAKYKLQPTMFQNRSTYDKYMKIYKRQTKLREIIAFLLTMPLKETQKITLLEYKNKKLFVNIKGVKKESENRLFSKLNEKNIKYKTSYNGDSIKVELSL
ncbi:hypothetical protein JHD47_07985 [Sulfurimonas sp. SAG-AH-194-L11]|nr:hypothetical protein [Sulfurimonas sp. SAG-AH-194-L11]MDF1877754.1 hypothetical protein [Sulfurimonas sp. SAG-AH-194-L11]